MDLSVVIAISIVIIELGFIIFMIKVPPDKDKGPFNPRPGLAAELARHRRNKRRRRMRQ